MRCWPSTYDTRRKLSGQPCKRRIRRLSRRNKTAKATLRQTDRIERAMLMTNNLTNNLTNNSTNALDKNELWRRKLSICQHSSPASRFAKLRLNKRYKPGD